MKFNSNRGGMAGAGLAVMRHATKGHAWRAFGLLSAPPSAATAASATRVTRATPAVLVPIATTLAAAIALTIAAPSVHAQQADARRRIERDISVMERALDEMLIDSPNFFVSGRGNTRGLYVEGLGALFTFEATLVNKDWDFDFNKWQEKGYHYEVEQDGDKIIIYKDGKKLTEDYKGGHPEPPEPPEPPELDEDDESADEDEAEADARARRAQRKRMAQRDEKIYARGKQEMIDFVLDFGDAIDGLRDDQMLVLVAYLRDHEYFENNDISHFVVRAKVGDLRAYAGGSLTEQALVAKLTQEEY
jgi:hypothetical protein